MAGLGSQNTDPTRDVVTPPPGGGGSGLLPRDAWGNAGTGKTPDSGAGPQGWLATIADRISSVTSTLSALLTIIAARLLDSSSVSAAERLKNVQVGTDHLATIDTSTGHLTTIDTSTSNAAARLLDSASTSAAERLKNIDAKLTASDGLTGAEHEQRTEYLLKYTGAGSYADTQGAAGYLKSIKDALGVGGTLDLDLGTGGTLHSDVQQVHGDLGTGGTLHSDLISGGTSIHNDLTAATTGFIRNDLAALHTDLGAGGTLHGDFITTIADLVLILNALKTGGDLLTALGTSGAIYGQLHNSNSGKSVAEQFNSSDATLYDLARLVAPTTYVSASLAGTGSVAAGPLRLFSISITTAPTGAVGIKDGVAGLNIATIPNGATGTINFEGGIYLASGIYIGTAAPAGAAVFTHSL